MQAKKVSMSELSELRRISGAGVVDCKKALQESESGLEGALLILRKNGIASATKKAAKVASEGITVAFTSEEKDYGAVFELNSQTDFVAKNQKFIDFSKLVQLLCLDKQPKTLEELKELKLPDSKESVAEKILSLSAEVGEKIDLRRFFSLKAKSPEEKVSFYCHPIGFKVSVLVLSLGSDSETGRSLAMHIAAANPAPEFVFPEQIPAERAEQEKKIENERAEKDESLTRKPKEVFQKIVEGRVSKRLAEFVLCEQSYIKDPSITVGEYCKKNKIVLVDFIRLNLGEGIEKKVSSFSEEVAAQTKRT